MASRRDPSPSASTLRIRPVDHRDTSVAAEMRAILARAHAQEVALMAPGAVLNHCLCGTISVVAAAWNIPALSLYDRLRFVPHRVRAMAADGPVLIQLRRTAALTTRASPG